MLVYFSRFSLYFRLRHVTIVALDLIHISDIFNHVRAMVTCVLKFKKMDMLSHDSEIWQTSSSLLTMSEKNGEV